MRKITIEIDAGETTCGACQFQVYRLGGSLCIAFMRQIFFPVSTGQYTRLPACIAAEVEEDKHGA